MRVVTIKEILGDAPIFERMSSTPNLLESEYHGVSKGPGKLLQNLVRVIADLRGKFWPDLGPEIADLRLQSGHLGANCVRL